MDNLELHHTRNINVALSENRGAHKTGFKDMSADVSSTACMFGMFCISSITS